MKSIRILYSQNKLYNEVSRDAYYAGEQNEFAIRLVFSGYEQYTMGKRSYNVYPGNFMIINKGTLYNRKIYSNIPSNTFAVLFDAKFLSKFHSAIINTDACLLDDPFKVQKEHPSFLETIYPLKGHLMYNMQHLKNHFHNNAVDDLLIDDYLYHGLLLFYQLYNAEVIAKSKQLNILDSKTREEIFKRLNIAKDFMLSYYSQPITLDDVSSVACISAPHLFRTFKQTFHCSPHQFLTKVRLDNALHMLKGTKYSLNEIVNMVGFTYSNSFIKLFKKQFGFTPSRCRNGDTISAISESGIYTFN